MSKAAFSYRKILVYGVTGSGKTTLARSISEATGIPWHSVDDLTFEPGWVQVADEEQRRRISEICQGDQWILDTAYGRWIDIPLTNVELIVALDYPRWLSFSRLFRRTLWRLVDGKTICNGNRETLKNFFSKDAILLWHIKSFQSKRNRMNKWSDWDDGPRLIRFEWPWQAERWLKSLPPPLKLSD